MKKPLIFLALAASLFAFTTTTAEARHIVFSSPVVVGPGYGYNYYNDYYGYGPAYPYGYGYPGYYYGESRLDRTERTVNGVLNILDSIF